MASNLSMNTLLKYASAGGVACVVMASLHHLQMNTRIKNAQYFKDAMNLLQEHKAADMVLGKPVNSGYIDVFSSKNYADVNKANLYIPLKGTKTKGELFFNAVKDENDKWLLKRVELEIKDNLGGRILIFDNNNSTI
ncbi:cytochrome c oxidase assembly factor 1 homolog [Lycorma delicatula]|uniref:cytochrome c oxidase assembly factor 1 homolog n=1 Tax=Lycorma delicatula TaxID=130591 RepID=UPI003F50F774